MLVTLSHILNLCSVRHCQCDRNASRNFVLRSAASLLRVSRKLKLRTGNILKDEKLLKTLETVQTQAKEVTRPSIRYLKRHPGESYCRAAQAGACISSVILNFKKVCEFSRGQGGIRKDRGYAEGSDGNGEHVKTAGSELR